MYWFNSPAVKRQGKRIKNVNKLKNSVTGFDRYGFASLNKATANTMDYLSRLEDPCRERLPLYSPLIFL